MIAKSIPDVPEMIVKAAAAGKLVVFVGAGVSRVVGCPLWSKFAQDYLRDVRLKGGVSYFEEEQLKKLKPRQILSICQRIIETKKLTQPDLKFILKGDKEKLKKYGRIFKDLYDFNGIYITTNYDDKLDLVAPDASVIYSKGSLLTSNLDVGNILHIHGSQKDFNSLVITLEDYFECYKDGGEVNNLLKEVFQDGDFTVLFVGYGLEEEEILELIVRKLRKISKAKLLPHFMLYPIFDEHGGLLKLSQLYYDKLGITLKPFSISGGGYENLAEVIKLWAKKIRPIARPQGYTDKLDILDKGI